MKPADMAIVSFPEYPFAEFARDFDAVNSEVNLSEHCELMGSLMVLREYMHKTYPPSVVRTRRSCALGMCFTFISENIAALDFGPFAIYGRKGSMFSEPVFRAAYEVAGGFALDPRRPEPDLKEFIRRATIYAKEEAAQASNNADPGGTAVP
jgi:hypothetical protein